MTKQAHMNLPPFPPTRFDSYAMEHSTFAAIQPLPPRADWRHAGRRGVRWNVVGDIIHTSGVKLHVTLAQCTSPAEAEFWAAIWPSAAEIVSTFGHGFPV
jgi:hypothetical protein